jgi:hypothetical protein
MTESEKQSTAENKSKADDDERLSHQPGDVNEGHDTGALEEASERMLLRKDRT